ncbi:UNVERIFIED_CONTAM: hypothetical protein HDU68_007166 [Siphonaria sp. JEL0065]|nr:hypothetical protein HDU68_007166 [Siphonaria sp. JEL0065]
MIDNIPTKTTLEFSINQVTGEKAVFANDWPVTLISDRIKTMLSIAEFPIAAFAVGCSTGMMIGTSSNVPTYGGDKIFTINEVNDPFVRDFSAFVNTSYQGDLAQMAKYIDANFPGTQNWFIDRKIGGNNWKLGLNTYPILGQNFLFAVYMNIDSVELQLSTLSTRTGYMMIGIIFGFVTVGVFYATLLARQLHTVVSQIRLLKDLKFTEVMHQGEIKENSFIYELAELQYCFHGMVVVFADFLKRNSSMVARPSLAKDKTVAVSDADARPARESMANRNFWRKEPQSRDGDGLLDSTRPSTPGSTHGGSADNV